jgi:hypothetical protein
MGWNPNPSLRTSSSQVKKRTARHLAWKIRNGAVENEEDARVSLVEGGRHHLRRRRVDAACPEKLPREVGDHDVIEALPELLFPARG